MIYTPDGESIVSALKGAGFTRQTPIYWEWAPAREHPETWPHLGIRKGKWKMLLNDQLGKLELYDIENDWAEKRDLSKPFPEIVEALTKELHAWKRTLPEHPPEACFSRLRQK